MRRRVLILTRAGDTPADHVAQLLIERGVDVVVFDPGQLPSYATVSVTVSQDGTPRRRLTAADRVINLDGLSAIWFRRPTSPTPDAAITDPVARRYVQRECAAFAADLWDGLECLAVPAPDAVTRRASGKVSQLVEAGRLGFELPPTLITTDPDELLDFYCAHDGRIVTKVIEQLWDEDFGRLTQLVSAQDVGYADAIRLCPVIVQPYVDKLLELRVTVVGTQVFAAEIHSQESNQAHVDWRRYDMRTTPHRIHRLPDATAARCLRLVQRLGLCYGAIDLILTPDGRYVFLEINPSGQYLWIERATGLPISDALCNLMLDDEARPHSEPTPLVTGVR